LWREDLRTWSGAAEGDHDTNPEVLLLHADAVLTPRQRLRLARLVVEENWPKRRAAESFGVAWKTADRWAERYRTLGKAGMVERSSRPHASPAKTDPATTKRIVALRLRKHWVAVRLAAETGVAPSTAGAVLRRCRISRLSRLERREHPRGALRARRPWRPVARRREEAGQHPRRRRHRLEALVRSDRSGRVST
jgi:transposase